MSRLLPCHYLIKLTIALFYYLYLFVLAESRKRDAPFSDTPSIPGDGKVPKLDETLPSLMSCVSNNFDDRNRSPGPAHGPSDDKYVPSHVIGTSSDPDLDIYERRRREVLSDPLLDSLPPPGDRFGPPHHPIFPLPPPFWGKGFFFFSFIFLLIFIFPFYENQ